jgi:hypothetical protein
MNRRIIAALVASIGISGPLIQGVRAQSNPVHREDREGERDEVRLDVPRQANGAIDLDKLAAEIRQAFRNGAEEVRVRERGLSAQERRQLADLARQLAAQLGAARVIVRNDDDRLRIELRDKREARDDRREDRREDRADRREDRREDRLDRREDRVERRDRPDRMARAERVERVERVERAERPERPERAERAERPDRPDRSGRH